jgi:uncharacterized membrane-anchored protein
MTSLRWVRVGVVFVTLAVFLYLVNNGVIQTERRIAEGTPVYLALAPVDPRSLFQGDYMQLDYAIERDATLPSVTAHRRGQIVAQVDADGVAHYVRRYTGEQPLAGDEMLLNYHTRTTNDVRIGVDSFFFQEGMADVYDNAEYAEVRVTPGGDILLIDLVGADFEQLTPPEEA